MKKWLWSLPFLALSLVLFWLALPDTARYDIIASEWCSPVPYMSALLKGLCYIGGIVAFFAGILVWQLFSDREGTGSITL